MNTKGMKFLAVLAVLAMAFAAFAVIAPAETDGASSAESSTATWDGAGRVLTVDQYAVDVIEYVAEITIQPGKVYYFSDDATITLASPAATAAPILFLIETGKEVELTVADPFVGGVFIAGLSVTKTVDDNGKSIYTAVSIAGAGWIGASNGLVTGQDYGETAEAVEALGNALGFGSVDAGATYTYVADDERVWFYGETSSEFINVISSSPVFKGTNHAKLINCVEDETSTWTFKSYTGVVQTDVGETEVISLNNFTGSMTIANATGVATIATWTSGDVALTTSGEEHPVVLGVAVPANYKITAGNGTHLSTSGTIVNAGKIVLSNTSIVTAGASLTSVIADAKNTVEVSGFAGAIDATDNAMTVSTWTAGTIEQTGGAKLDLAAVPDGGTLIIDSGATAKATSNTFTLNYTCYVVVKGTLDLSGVTYANYVPNGNFITTLNGSKLYMPSNPTGEEEAEAAWDSVTYIGGTVYHYVDAANVDETSLYEAGSMVVSDMAAFETAIDAGVTAISTGTAFNLTKNLTLPTGAALDTTGGAITLGSYTLDVVNGSVTGPITGEGQTVTFDGLAGTFTLSKGSVLVNGSIASGEIALGDTATTLVLTGSLNGTLYISSTSTANNQTVIFKNFVVNGAGKLRLSDNTHVTYDVGTVDQTASVYMYVYGTIISAYDEDTEGTGATINVLWNTVQEKYSSKFVAYAGALVSGKVIVTGPGDIDMSQAQNVQKVDEDISADKVYGQLEAVEIIDSVSIRNNSQVTILGTLTINEGVVLTVEEGSKLIVDSDIASVIIKGKVIIEDGAEIEIVDADSVEISGTLQSSGTIDIQAESTTTTIKEGGLIEVRDDDGSSIAVAGEMTVSKGAELKIRGQMELTGNVYNKGTITLSGADLKDDSTITMAGTGAVVNVVLLMNTSGADKNFIITDAGLKFTSKLIVGSGDYAGYQNTITMPIADGNVLKGLTVTETVTSYTYDGTTYYTNHMDLSGAIVYVDDNSKPVNITVTANGKNMEVNSDLVIAAGVTFTNAQKLAVVGDIIAIATTTEVGVNNATIAGGVGSMITVTGEIVTVTAIDNAANVISAAYYTEEVLGDTYHHYTTLAAAVAEDVDTIRTYGTVVVASNLDIPTGKTINNYGTISIGTSIAPAVDVTVADGSVIKNGTIDVYGSITFENKKDCKANSVLSDVTVINGNSVTYTSLSNAISKSSAGDVITITRDGATDITTSMTIPEGRIVNVPASKYLVLAPGVTLTVNGMLQTAEKVLVDTSVYPTACFGTKASLTADPKTAAIVVNGTFRSMADLEYGYYMTAGAYYSIADSDGAYNYVSPIATAVGTTAKSITVYGEVSTGSVEWKGTSTSAKTFTIASDAEITAGSFSLSYVNFVGTGTFTGILSYGANSVVATEVTGLNIVNKDGDNVVMLVNSVTIAGEDSSFTIAAGEVFAKVITGDATVASGATLSVPTGGLTMTGDLTVDGILNVANGRIATIAGDTEIMGTINVAKESADGTKAAGTLEMEDVYLGITEKAVIGTSAAAAISGPVAFDILYAAAGTGVPEEVIDDTSMKFTVFVVDDAEYITAYTKATTYYIEDVYFYLETADFGGWYNADKKSADEYNAKIGASDWAVVYADLDYYVYNLFVKTDNGVKSVAVDGKELINIGNNVFVSYSEPLGFQMSAGKYVLTFTLKDGYEGTPVLYDADGKAVLGGYGITIAGDADHRIVTYQLSGTEQITVEPVTPEEQSEWTITTILLVILVILIAIMAVIVAIRLNRS